MKGLNYGIAVMTFGAMASSVIAQDYGTQIDALQNELLKMKQEMNSEKNKAYFVKGKGLSIKSIDGKYKFAIKGRIMYDVGGVLDYENTAADGTTTELQEHGLGTEFRRLDRKSVV